MMTVLEDLQAADAALKSGVAALQTSTDTAIQLIKTLQANQTPGGSVSDADVETVVADMAAASKGLSAASDALNAAAQPPAPPPTEPPPAA